MRASPAGRGMCTRSSVQDAHLKPVADGRRSAESPAKRAYQLKTEEWHRKAQSSLRLPRARSVYMIPGLAFAPRGLELPLRERALCHPLALLGRSAHSDDHYAATADADDRGVVPDGTCARDEYSGAHERSEAHACSVGACGDAPMASIVDMLRPCWPNLHAEVAAEQRLSPPKSCAKTARFAQKGCVRVGADVRENASWGREMTVWTALRKRPRCWWS
eukprot:6203054-Pleurochrysis_carterae.AAC.1